MLKKTQKIIIKSRRKNKCKFVVHKLIKETSKIWVNVKLCKKIRQRKNEIYLPIIHLKIMPNGRKKIKN